MTMIPPKIKKLPELHKRESMGYQKRQPPAPPQAKGLLYQAGRKKMGNS